MSIGYPTGYQETSTFTGYSTGDVNNEMMRSGMDFVPLKTIHDDHDTDSVISGLHGSPDTGPLNETSGYQDMEYQSKVLLLLIIIDCGLVYTLTCIICR